MTWTRLEAEDPGLAAAGERLLGGSDGVHIGFLATVSVHGGARISPVCPIFSDGDVYLSIGAHTPKAGDLRRTGVYALHAFLGEKDEEFQCSGHATVVEDSAERSRVHRAIRFPSFDRDDPVFRLSVDRAFWAKWDGPSERPSQRRAWRWAGGPPLPDAR
jgi:hypothetical protein